MATIPMMEVEVQLREQEQHRWKVGPQTWVEVKITGGTLTTPALAKLRAFVDLLDPVRGMDEMLVPAERPLSTPTPIPGGGA